MGRKNSTGPSLLIFSLLMTLTYLLFSNAPLAVSPPLTFHLLPPLSRFLAHGRCFRTWVLIIYQFFYLSLSLQSFGPTSVSLPSILRELAGIILLLALTFIVLPQRNILFQCQKGKESSSRGKRIFLCRRRFSFLFPLLLLSLPFWH